MSCSLSYKTHHINRYTLAEGIKELIAIGLLVGKGCVFCSGTGEILSPPATCGNKIWRGKEEIWPPIEVHCMQCCFSQLKGLKSWLLVGKGCVFCAGTGEVLPSTATGMCGVGSRGKEEIWLSVVLQCCFSKCSEKECRKLAENWRRMKSQKHF